MTKVERWDLAIGIWDLILGPLSFALTCWDLVVNVEVSDFLSCYNLAQLSWKPPMSDPIAIKGIREGLLVTVDEAGNWAETSHTLLEQIDHAADFFKGARLALAIGPRTLSAAELG